MRHDLETTCSTDRLEKFIGNSNISYEIPRFQSLSEYSEFRNSNIFSQKFSKIFQHQFYDFVLFYSKKVNKTDGDSNSWTFDPTPA
jgi:hypothetical protein